jgi:acetoin utilization protein AcuB
VCLGSSFVRLEVTEYYLVIPFEGEFAMKKELVSCWMSHDPITVTPNTAMLDAGNIMRKYEIRASPSDANSLSIWELNYLLTKVKVKQIMIHNPITVYSTDTISTAASLMLKNKVGGLPVINPLYGFLMGIITETDIFRLIVRTWREPGAEEVTREINGVTQ